MLKGLFWVILSFVVIICGSVVRSEASVIQVRSSPGLSQNTGGGQTGGSGGTISLGGQNRVGASGRSGHRIPKPEKDDRGRRKGKAAKRKAKKCGKSKKKGCKKSSKKKHRKRKMRSLSLTEQERLSKAKRRKGGSDDRLAVNGSVKSVVSEDLKIRNERADDIPLLLGIMMQMGMDRVIDNHIPKHRNKEI